MKIHLPALRSDESTRRTQSVITGLSREKAWDIEIDEHKPEKPRRSEQQNKYLWGCVYKAITDKLVGWDAEDVHEYCLGECFGWETIEAFGRKRIRPVRRSSRLNKQEFADYVAWIQRKMAEHGIDIPNPNEDDFYAP